MRLTRGLEDFYHGMCRAIYIFCLSHARSTAPRFAHSGETPVAPTWDWVNRVPALDNGENIWAIYSVIQALQSTRRADYQTLANDWQTYLDYLKTTMRTVRFSPV